MLGSEPCLPGADGRVAGERRPMGSLHRSLIQKLVTSLGKLSTFLQRSMASTSLACSTGRYTTHPKSVARISCLNVVFATAFCCIVCFFLEVVTYADKYLRTQE